MNASIVVCDVFCSHYSVTSAVTQTARLCYYACDELTSATVNMLRIPLLVMHHTYIMASQLLTYFCCILGPKQTIDSTGACSSSSVIYERIHQLIRQLKFVYT